MGSGWDPDGAQMGVGQDVDVSRRSPTRQHSAPFGICSSREESSRSYTSLSTQNTAKNSDHFGNASPMTDLL